MIREVEVKRAFRIAYDTLAKCGEPKYTPEYLEGVIDMFGKVWHENGDDGLLKHLSIAICEWLIETAETEDQK